MSTIFYIVTMATAVITAALITVILLRRSAKYFADKKFAEEVNFLGGYSPVLSLIRSSFTALVNRFPRLRPLTQLPWQSISEILLIGAWAMWVGHVYLDFDPLAWLIGREFGFQIQPNYFILNLKQCGLCALWNGGLNGGWPALADPFGSHLHPIVAIPTLLWGTIVGAKIAIVIALWLAGIAQWWLARTLNLGLIARLWSAFIAVSAGHLMGRLELPLFGIIVSTAALSLTIAAAFDLAINKNPRTTILLALTGALSLISGQGYMQLGFLIFAPALIFFMFDDRFRPTLLWREFAIAFALSLLLVSFFAIPYLHFLPNFEKDLDATFSTSQPFEYIPLNLVINEIDFQLSSVLGKQPYPALYNLHIGWFPMLFALTALFLARKRDWRPIAVLCTGVILLFWAASAEPFRWLANHIPQIAAFRHILLVAGLAIPLILALSAYGLDRLLQLEWPNITVKFPVAITSHEFKASLSWLLIFPLFWSVSTSYAQSQSWVGMDDATFLFDDISILKTEDTQWAAIPLGNHIWVEAGMSSGLKLSQVAFPWRLKNRYPPEPRLEMVRHEPDGNPEKIGLVDNAGVYLYPDRWYAAIKTKEQLIPCQAESVAGRIIVNCETSEGGKLVVRENAFPGWIIQIDGVRSTLLEDTWLAVDAPAGKHEYRFDYLPMDVFVGVIFSAIGLVISIFLWKSRKSSK
ncbi:MAG: hypothetical protein U9N80_10680 [Chloroflexota bacterium]|nr:hypothetical protein [Chloroflexota bacterium]